jgi:hypothetical protein
LRTIQTLAKVAIKSEDDGPSAETSPTCTGGPS